MLTDALKPYRYLWPQQDFAASSAWQPSADGQAWVRTMPESPEELEADSRWPAFFPSPLCFVTVRDGDEVGLEKVVGASIVNRFPYILALSFCRQELSQRHHARRTFTGMLERGGAVAVQYLPPGPMLDRVLHAILSVPEGKTRTRIAQAGLATRPALTNEAPVFTDSYLIYEARLVKPGKDFEGQPIYQEPWWDVGSHRIYFLEINAIQLRRDIAESRSQIQWRSLPAWQPQFPLQGSTKAAGGASARTGYQKGYTPHYVFPSAGTTAFEADCVHHNMAVKHLPPLAEDQMEVDNDRARWPCFFPSSAGLITTWAGDGLPNVMPCGSTTIVSRHPLVIAPCVSYAAINIRYAPRATLGILQRTKRFGCGVPFIHDAIIDAIRQTGNVSIETDRNKVARAGLTAEAKSSAPVLSAVPVHFDCAVVDQVRLGTHVMFLGEVQSIRVRADVTPENPIEWYPWADVVPVGA
jgi:flavin reductase (DIM6/NTAB) family NADH-FMN oxidoreductase RutF